MNEEKIIKKCKKNDLSAYKMIYDRYGQPLLRTALRILGQQQDAEDAIQTTFLKLFRGIQNYNHSAKFSTYLFRILINVCFDILRKRKRALLHKPNKDRYFQKPNHEEKMGLEEAIASLPHRMRACFVLFAVEEFKQSEIAELLNMSLGGVKATIYQAKRRLRTMLTESRIEEKS